MQLWILVLREVRNIVWATSFNYEDKDTNRLQAAADNIDVDSIVKI